MPWSPYAHSSQTLSPTRYALPPSLLATCFRIQRSLVQDCLRSDCMQPMHHDLSFSSLVSHVAPPVRGTSFRTPCCRGRSTRSSSRTLGGRIGDIAPHAFDSTFVHQTSDCAGDDEARAEQGSDGDMRSDDGCHLLEIDIVSKTNLKFVVQALPVVRKLLTGHSAKCCRMCAGGHPPL